MNKASLLDPQLKSLVHLTEEEQTSSIVCLVNEIVSTVSRSPVTVVCEEPALVALDE